MLKEKKKTIIKQNLSNFLFYLAVKTLLIINIKPLSQICIEIGKPWSGI